MNNKKIEKLKFPKERITSKTKQEEIPTVREIVEKINEIIEVISSEEKKEDIEYPFDLFKNGFEPEFTRNDMFKSFLFCSIGQAISEAIRKYKSYYMVPESLEKMLRFIIKDTAKSIIKEVKKQKK